MNYDRKYSMTKEENLFVAKRNMVDYIWKSANLEGIPVTFPDTATICDGISVEGKSIDDINNIVQLKRGWQYLFENIDAPVDLEFIQRCHSIIGKMTIIWAGNLRLEDVYIKGTTWKPGVPNRDEVIRKLEELNLFSSPTERALETMLYLARTQLFYDGNKRVSMLVANKVMIQNGCGIISVAQEHRKSFYDKLVRYYETGEKEELKIFLYENCIDGMDFSKERKQYGDE